MSQTDLKFYRQEGQELVPLGSARGCKQLLEPIQQLEKFRTINGSLFTFNTSAHEKYRSVIECDDIYPVALEGIWPGTSIWVECLSQMMTGTIPAGGTLRFKRKPVSSSIMIHIKDKTPEFVTQPLDPENSLQLLPNQGPGFISYRPLLHMVVSQFVTKTNEWDRTAGWRMELEEL